ncbi:hypothetical protein CIPAW_05G199400 [Carya illinoinensis]|uniref:Uncharacterized protein n=1 Tax=Carya illinoinensis TaxID=32201 RepID=A0A8T1QL35_CARIL|nr:hypothetical protein CIPAW_05G199400 [Carya illinoinensis]
MRICKRSSLSIFSCSYFVRASSFSSLTTLAGQFYTLPDSISSNPTYPRLPHPPLSLLPSLSLAQTLLFAPLDHSPQKLSLSSSLSASPKYEMVKLSYITFFVGLSM